VSELGAAGTDLGGERGCGVASGPIWWEWGLDLSPHLLKRMADRRFTEIDLRRMLERASGHRRDVVEGRWGTPESSLRSKALDDFAVERTRFARRSPQRWAVAKLGHLHGDPDV
jgi:hypothetical protein